MCTEGTQGSLQPPSSHEEATWGVLRSTQDQHGLQGTTWCHHGTELPAIVTGFRDTSGSQSLHPTFSTKPGCFHRIQLRARGRKRRFTAQIPLIAFPGRKTPRLFSNPISGRQQQTAPCCAGAPASNTRRGLGEPQGRSKAAGARHSGPRTSRRPFPTTPLRYEGGSLPHGG